MIITIKRKVRYARSIGGELEVDGSFVCDTLELPWRWNKKDVSCIPPGTYTCWWRHDRGRVQVEQIPCPGGHRVGIQIHSGNTPEHTEGCILVGKSISPNHVGDSQKTMRLLERAIFGDMYGPGYPSKKMQLRIGGVLMNTMYDMLQKPPTAFNGLVII